MMALLAAGADVDQADSHSQQTPLAIATRHRHIGTVAALLAAGASVNRADHSGRTPIDIAVQYGYTTIIDALRMGRSSDCTGTVVSGCSPTDTSPKY